MQICKNCVLDELFPRIKFNEDGICNFCCSAKETKDQQTKIEKSEKRFRRLIQQHKGEGSYDCLVAYSGGKDSTYTLHLLKNHYHLNLLAFSFDNWFQSESAIRNIRTVLYDMNVDHWCVMPSFETIRKIILASIADDAYSRQALVRASSICTSCISLIRFIGFRIAIEQEIPFVAFGMSPGQAPIATAVVKTNAQMVRRMQNVVLQPLSEHLGDAIRPFFLEKRHFDKEDKFPYSINPLAFTNYDEESIIKIAQEYGWNKPEDTDANSTNCLLNAFANQVHMERFGFNPYAYEVAELVRTSRMTREEGLKRLSEALPSEQIVKVKGNSE